MLKKNFHYKVLLVILGILLFPGLVCAERDYVEEILNTPREDQVAFLQSLSEDELLTMANQVWCKNRIETPWQKSEVVDEEIHRIRKFEMEECIIIYGLEPIWNKKPPKAEKYLPIIQDRNLHPAWRGGLITIIIHYIDNWNYENTEQLIDYIFKRLKDSNEQIELRRGCVRNLYKLVYKKTHSAIESKN